MTVILALDCHGAGASSVTGGAAAARSGGSKDVFEAIKEQVLQFEYSEETANALVQLVSAWEDAKGRPCLPAWKLALEQARRDFANGRLSGSELAKTEGALAEGLAITVMKAFSGSADAYELTTVVKKRQAQCQSRAMLLQILGNSLELEIQGIEVDVQEMRGVEDVTFSSITSTGHVANLLLFSDKTSAILDASVGILSRPFSLAETYAKNGNYWEIKNTNVAWLHARFRVCNLLAALHLNRGKTLADLGRYAEAEPEDTRAIELDPQFSLAFFNRAVGYTKQGRHADAIADYTKAIELNPKFAKAYLIRGAAYFRLDHHNKAIPDFTKVIELDSTNTIAWFTRACSYFQLRQYSEALSGFSRVSELDPNNALYRKHGAVCYLALNDLPRARKEMQKALKLTTDKKEKENIRLALTKLDHAAKAAANSPQTTSGTSAAPQRKALREALEKAQAARASGNLPEIIVAYSKAIDIDPTDAAYFNNRGEAYSEMGQLPQAVSNFTQAIRLDPKLAVAFCNRGSISAKLGQNAEAILDFGSAIELDPKNPRPYLDRGVALSKAGQQAQAISDLTKTIELDPKDPLAYRNRGLIYTKLGQEASAIADFTSVLELDPKDSVAYINRGNLYLKSSQLDRARADYRKALDFTTDGEAKKQLLNAITQLDDALKE